MLRRRPAPPRPAPPRPARRHRLRRTENGPKAGRGSDEAANPGRVHFLVYLAVFYLLAWDAPRLLLLVRGSGAVDLQPPIPHIRGATDRVAFALLLGSGLVFTLSARGYFGSESGLVMLGGLLVGAIGGGLYLLMTWCRRALAPA